MATSLFEDILREKPSVPDWQNIDPTQVQRDTTSGNAASFAAAKDLAQQYNDFQAQQMQRRLAQTFPQFAGLQDLGAKVISDRLKGVISTSDAAASQRTSAARALGLGTAGSPAGAALTLRDLGIRQYQSQNEGEAMLPGFAQTVNSTTKAPMFDFSNVFLNPAQRWQMTMQNQENAWNVQWLKNQVAAQPSGIAWAFAKQGDEDIEMAKQAAVSYFSGGMGGGGGGPGVGSAPKAGLGGLGAGGMGGLGF